jgi:tartrate dehydratase alpha subunit/fumarate hydratase class I-like protein
MSEALSLSIFTIEADHKPLLAFATKKHEDAEAFCADARVLTKLRAAKSGGEPLCDDKSIMRIRLATSEEQARYQDRAKQRASMENRAAVFLVNVDEA